MIFNWRQISFSIGALLLSIIVTVVIFSRPAELGAQPLAVRALLMSTALFFLLLALYPLRLRVLRQPVLNALLMLLIASAVSVSYYFFYLPSRVTGGLSASQFQSDLITDRSSNGIIEVGFSYPIFTPTLQLQNHELFTKQVNVFLRITDANNEDVLFRAVRSQIDNAGLSVEATVQGMLSENSSYLFSPLVIPPLGSVIGRVAFIISNLNDGTTFTEALGRAYQAKFEFREPVTGDLLLSLPLSKI